MRWTIRNAKMYSPYIAICLAILAPLLLPGFVLTLDMVFTPTIPMPEQVTSSYAFYVLLHVLNMLLPADVLQKILLLTILLLSSIGMHRFLATLQTTASTGVRWEIYAASMFYMVNPFTYGRFMAGQFAVLLGYALLPWLARRLYMLWHHPTVTQALMTGVLIALIGILSIHSLGLVTVLAITGLIAGTWNKPLPNAPRLRAIAITVLVAVLASSYWLIPLLLGHGQTAMSVAQFGPQDTTAFATTGHNLINQMVHLARLQGFWLEGRDMFTLPQQLMPLWGIVVLGLWILVGYGVRVMWHTRRRLLVWMALCVGIAGIASLGYPFMWLSNHWHLAAGFREPQKFTGLIALGYCVLIAYAGGALLEKWQQHSGVKHSLALGGLLLLPILLTPTMFWGFSNQLRAAHYPPEWEAVNRRLAGDPDNFSVLYLPWHQYMSYSFAGRIVATPAHDYFSKPMVASDNPELNGATAVYTSSSSKAAGAIVSDASKRTDMGTRLAKQNIKYIVLVKEYDYQKYRYLREQDNMQILIDTDTIALYRNHYWRK